MLKLSVEKEQKLAALLDEWIVRKGGKRLGSKEKARLAAKVGTCADNVQYHWQRYKKRYLKKVRKTILTVNALFCEHFFFSGIECTNSASCTKHFLETQAFLCDKDQEERERGI